MHNQIKVIYLASAICAIAMNHGRAQTNSNLVKLSDEIEHQLLVFQTNKTVESVQQLRSSINNLRNVESGDRRGQTRIWFELLAVIDSNLDADYSKSSPHLVWKVTPPPDGEGGIQYPPGVSPETLKDTVARSNYVAAMGKNDEKLKTANLQSALNKLNERTSQSFERFLKSSYTSGDADKRELDEFLEKSKLSVARKQQIAIAINSLPASKPSAKEVRR